MACSPSDSSTIDRTPQKTDEYLSRHAPPKRDLFPCGCCYASSRISRATDLYPLPVAVGLWHARTRGSGVFFHGDRSGLATGRCTSLLPCLSQFTVPAGPSG